MVFARTALTITCMIQALAAVADQAVSGPPTQNVLNVSPSNTTFSLTNATTPIDLAWNLGSNPSIMQLILLDTITATNFSMGNKTRVGPLLVGDPSNVQSITTSNIVIIPCDPGFYVGSVGMYEVVNAAINAEVAAIVFASETSDTCQTNASIESSSPYVYTTTQSMAAMLLIKELTNGNQTDPQQGSIAAASLFANTTQNSLLDGSAAVTHPGDADPNNNNNYNNNSGSDGSPSTAVAMIILYSITGVITFLFLLVIITGAIRAHRHPERYGPHNGGGLRRSRATGLARAMLETLPIVKFAVPEPEKPADVELASAARQASVETDGAIEKDFEKKMVQRSSSDASGAGRAASSIRSGIGPAAAVDSPVVAGSSSAASPRPTTAVADDNPGCSICTDDFEPGQDLRLLPCGHKFHPACVDPWLLNVSGTCPLCRVDLNRKLNNDNEAEEPERWPTVGDDGTPSGMRSRSRRLSRMALGRFVQTAPPGVRTNLRQARPRSGPMTPSGQYAQVSAFSPVDGQTQSDARNETQQDASPASPSNPASPTRASNVRHSR